MRHIRLAVVITALLGAAEASAAGVGIRAGTTGIGGDVAFDLVPTLSARFGYSWLNFNTSIDSTDVNYDAKTEALQRQSVPRLGAAGSIIPCDGRRDLQRQQGRRHRAGERRHVHAWRDDYPAAAVGSLAGTVKSGSSAAPYLGIGYGRVAGAGVNFYADLGVMFQGTPKATLTATCGPATPAALCSQIQASTALEAIDLQDSIKNFKYYPVANIGVTIGF